MLIAGVIVDVNTGELVVVTGVMSEVMAYKQMILGVVNNFMFDTWCD